MPLAPLIFSVGGLRGQCKGCVKIACSAQQAEAFVYAAPFLLLAQSWRKSRTPMVLPKINSLIESAAGDSPLFPRTDIFNETWLVRLVVDWFAHNAVPNFPLNFAPNAHWFSEALLPSAFLARSRGDSLAESWTHADATIGHFNVGSNRKADCTLHADANQFIVIEAKIFSRLSPGVANAPYFDQCARNVACIAEVLKRAERSPDSIDSLGFYILAPESRINAQVFANQMHKQSIHAKVQRRVVAYDGSCDLWFHDWFVPLLERVTVVNGPF